jgi:uncharacterized glyoxalase superfamily protein PhnB
MVLNTLTPNIMVEDVEETVEWYEDAFDATLVATLPPGDGTPWWAQVVIDDITLMFQTRDSLVDEFPEMEGESGPGSTAFFIDVSDIRYFYDSLDDEVTVVQELSQTEHGRNQFAVQDCNGYILWFGEPVTNEPEGPIIR